MSWPKQCVNLGCILDWVKYPTKKTFGKQLEKSGMDCIDGALFNGDYFSEQWQHVGECPFWKAECQSI